MSVRRLPPGSGSSYRSDRFLSFVTSHEEFKPFLEAGLGRTITQTGMRIGDHLYETPHTVSWDRVMMKLPRIMYDIVDVIEAEKKIYQ